MGVQRSGATAKSLKRRRLAIQTLESRLAMAAIGDYCVPLPPLGDDTQPPPAIAPPAIRANATAPPDAGLWPSEPTEATAGEGEPSAPAAWSPLDASGDGVVTPLDALLILNRITLERTLAADDDDSSYRYDANEDGEITPLDTLIVLTTIGHSRWDGDQAVQIPDVHFTGPTQSTDDGFLAEELGFRIEVAAGTTRLFARVTRGSGDGPTVELSDLLSRNAVELTHSQLVERFAITQAGNLRFSFWSGTETSWARTHLQIRWQPRPVVVGDRWTENAESGLKNVRSQIDSSYSLLQSDWVSQGKHAFHLANPNWRPNWFELNRNLKIDAESQLYFMSRLGWAMPGQVATVQVSLDGGETWPKTIFSQAGAGQTRPTDVGFRFHQISLSDFAGETIRIRFVYENRGGSAIVQTDSDTGWVIDDIRIGPDYQTNAYSIGNPTNQEQWMLEIINRARAGAVADAGRLSRDSSLAAIYSFFKIKTADIVSQYRESVRNGLLDGSAQPLAFNAKLLKSTQLHSRDQLDKGFQGHASSSSPPAPFRPGFGPGQRAAALGYHGGVTENAYAYASSVEFAHAAFAVDWGGDHPRQQGYNPAFAGQGMQNPATHRINLHDNDFNEIGIGIVRGSNGDIGPMVVTQNFGTGSATVTGVVYADRDQNAFYSPGEGIGKVRVEVHGAAYHAVTASSGGYAIPVTTDGTYTVTFSGAGIKTWTTEVTVKQGRNSKLDYIL